MAKYAHADVLDGGLNAIKNGATRMLLISAYSVGDSYATVVANKVAEAVMASTDFTLSSSGSNRVVTTASKTATSTAATTASPDLHVAFTDGSAKVLWVTDEVSNVQIQSGASVTFPAVTYTSSQPT